MNENIDVVDEFTYTTIIIIVLQGLLYFDMKKIKDSLKINVLCSR